MHATFGQLYVELTRSQALYMSECFYIVSLGLSKTSAALFIACLPYAGFSTRLAYTTTFLSCVWTIAGFLAIALRGNIGQPWATLNGSEAMVSAETKFQVLYLDLAVLT